MQNTQQNEATKIYNPILSELMVERIGKVYGVLRKVITYNDHPMALEQFELGFMREQNAASTLQVWESIAFAYSKSCHLLPTENKYQIYKWLIQLVMGAVPEDEKDKPELKVVSKCFASVFAATQAAAEYVRLLSSESAYDESLMTLLVPIDRSRYVKLQKQFDVAMERSAHYEKMSQSWLIFRWPYAHLMWYFAHKKANDTIAEMKAILRSYPVEK